MTARMTRSRVAEVIVTCARGQRRGSGYRVTTDAVLTAAHVVDGATSIEVRFEADLPDQWTAAVAAWWADPDSDLAVLTIQPHSDGEAVPPAEFGRLADTSAAVPVTAVGFPQWKLRADEDTAEYYRDSYHATGNVASLSNWREGTLEVALSAAPGTGAADGRSPWEGMSGAVLWSGSRIIGVISRHHPRDGVSTLAATPIEGALARLSPQRLDQLRLLLPIPDAAELPVVVPGRDGDSGVTIDVCPYPTGMAAFSQEQAEWFFGRETLTAQLLGRLDDRLTRGGGR